MAENNAHLTKKGQVDLRMTLRQSYSSLSHSLLYYVLVVHGITLAFFFIVAPIVPQFDSSASASALSPLHRWDVAHFDHIAQHGYCYEHEWAFLPGIATVIRLFPNPIQSLPILLLLSIWSANNLYSLSLLTFKSNPIAKLATLLSLLPSNPVTLRLAPYAEPWFTAASYAGMLACAQESWLKAAVYFTIASCFRSNGITLAGFILWGMIVMPFLQTKKMSLSQLSKATLYVALVFSPFVYHNYSAYLAFCTHSSTSPSWCSNTIPSIYTHVQATYWNVGLFRYWSLQQLPNFLLAAPPLALVYSFAAYYLTHFNPRSPTSTFASPLLFPHIIHALFIASTLLFASHTQIALRLLPALPTLYWAAAWLFVDHARVAKLWVYWSFIWGGISIVLWLAFLPPA